MKEFLHKINISNFHLVLIIVLFVALLFGLIRGDYKETRVSGSALCFSCIGIYK
ncbi:MAG: hypothetical protein HQM16_12260 [Deltaproteobacteria bacterium]|nr:hypothetical protein [Deltaproteobacteria bacterium]